MSGNVAQLILEMDTRMAIQIASRSPSHQARADMETRFCIRRKAFKT